MSASRRRGASRLDPMAAAWGGLVGAVGLMVGSGRDLPARLLIVGAAFAVGGFLAGVRAINRRFAHALACWVVGHALYAAFVVTTWVVDIFGGPDAASLLPGGLVASVGASLLGLVTAVLGGLVADSWLRPAGQNRRYS